MQKAFGSDTRLVFKKTFSVQTRVDQKKTRIQIDIFNEKYRVDQVRLMFRNEFSMEKLRISYKTRIHKDILN